MREILKSRATRDAAVLVACSVVVWLVAVRFDLLDRLFDATRVHEGWELDEIILAVQVAGLFGFIYAFRRIRDLSEQIRLRQMAEADTTWIAHHDTLTKLPNRRGLDKFITEHPDADTDGNKYALYIIDLDGFKQANDLVGHEGGNQLLIEIAGRLTRLFPDDLVVRHGGDEFAVVAKIAMSEAALDAGREIIASIQVPTTIAGVGIRVGASVGVAMWPRQKPSLVDALKAADTAMYFSKRQGRNAVALFDAEMDEELRQRSKAEGELRDAIVGEQIVPFYQPLMDLRDGSVRGFEALARWHRADGEMIPPTVFIALAEEAGLITELSEQLLRHACTDALEWPSHIVLAFNISPRQVTDHLLSLRILQILGETGLPPQRLEIEITEGALIQDVKAATATIDALHNAGIRVVLDDFGTGYSSLGQLSRLKFDKVKIDRSFVSSFEADEKQEKIVRAIVGLGHGLGIFTTAEGIEHERQRDRLAGMGCDFGQGYLFGRAMSARDVAGFLSALQGVPHRGTSRA